jgi:MoaA/NifB/PqqE/SkfB family radical SAM enzyme
VSRILEPADLPPGERASWPPDWLVLDVNNHCNLHCVMCDVGLGDQTTPFHANLIGPRPQDMSRPTLDEILRQASAWKPRPRIAVALTEPLIHPQVVEFCAAIVAGGFRCSVTSNGWRLPQLAGPLCASGLDELTLSVDGPAAVHDRIRGRAGSFERLVEGARRVGEERRARRSGKPALQFSLAVTDRNAGHILDLVRELEPLAPERIVISQLNFVSAEMAAAHNAVFTGDLSVTRSNLGDIDPSRIDTRALWDELERVRAHARDRRLRLTLSPDFRRREDLDLYYREPTAFVGGRRCTDPWRMMLVRSDGLLLPAHGRCYHFPLGKLGQATLDEAWNGERSRRLRATLTAAGGTLPACARCCGVIGKPRPS